MNSPATIRIAHRDWVLDRPIGEGGFGRVWRASSGGQVGAIKLVPKIPGARRELLFADNLRGAINVVPVFEYDETDSSWVLLMPLAESTLRRHLEDVGTLPEAEARLILIDIARALVDLRSRGVVHRDLKPQNVLFYNGAWCLSDFGIARYANATTSDNTWKHSTTRPYAAPEQWRNETATSATDVYAFGVLSYELLVGSRPFPGPLEDDLRHQHLHDDPPKLHNVSPSLAALIEECLFKAPGARPTSQQVLSRLESQASKGTLGRGLVALEEANQAATAQLAAEGRRRSESRSDTERRAALLESARRQLDQISAALTSTVLDAAPQAKLIHRDYGWFVTLSSSMIGMSNLEPINMRQRSEGVVANSAATSRQLPFEVVAAAVLAIGGPRDEIHYAGRAHSLWFCDAEEPGAFSWYEIAFLDALSCWRSDYNMVDILRWASVGTDREPLFGHSEHQDAGSTWGSYLPHHCDPRRVEAILSFDPSDGSCAAVRPPAILRASHLDEFIDRWASWLADSVRGELHTPRLPPVSIASNYVASDTEVDSLVPELIHPLGDEDTEWHRRVALAKRYGAIPPPVPPDPLLSFAPGSAAGPSYLPDTLPAEETLKGYERIGGVGGRSEFESLPETVEDAQAQVEKRRKRKLWGRG